MANLSSLSTKTQCVHRSGCVRRTIWSFPTGVCVTFLSKSKLSRLNLWQKHGLQNEALTSVYGAVPLVSVVCSGEFFCLPLSVFSAVGVSAAGLWGAGLVCLAGEDVVELLLFLCGFSLELLGLCEQDSVSSFSGEELSFTGTEVTPAPLVWGVLLLFRGEELLDLRGISLRTGTFWSGRVLSGAGVVEESDEEPGVVRLSLAGTFLFSVPSAVWFWQGSASPEPLAWSSISFLRKRFSRMISSKVLTLTLLP